MDRRLRGHGCARWASGLALGALVGVLLCLGPATQAGAAADADPGKLWEAYPLVQKPSQTDRRVASVVHSVDYRYVTASRPGGVSYGGDITDSRFVLQLGMLLAFLYVGFLAVWFASTRNLRAEGAGHAVVDALRRAARRRSGD